ncbi:MULTISPECIES: hypothetical protein [Aurantimonas]|uniref:hypothetical protein n=1 Tax=Aurantimonas TaxID=182269 RepID=UPI003513EB08
MTMDLMQLEAFLDARCGHATEQANRHLSEKARHEDEAERNKQVAVFCDRAAVRIRGLREYLLQAPSGLAIEISASVKAEPAPEPAPVDDRADAVSPECGVVSGGGDADRLADEGDAPLRHDEAAVLPGTRAEHNDAGDAKEPERPVPEPAGAASSVQDDTADTDESPAAPEAQSPMEERLVPRLSVTPEAEGLTEYDQRFLDVMRMNLDRNGLCKLKPFDICAIADLNKATAGSCVLRLLKARRIVHSSGGAYRVSDKGGSFPPMQKAETPAVPPARPKVVSALADQLLEKFAAVAAKQNTDTVMFGREFLIEFAGAAKGDFLPVDHALAELGSRRAIEVTHRDKMNVTVRVLPIAEAAE